MKKNALDGVEVFDYCIGLKTDAALAVIACAYGNGQIFGGSSR